MWILYTSVADPHHIEADPAFHSDADPDPTFHCDADADTDPAFQLSGPNLSIWYESGSRSDH